MAFSRIFMCARHASTLLMLSYSFSSEITFDRGVRLQVAQSSDRARPLNVALYSETSMRQSDFRDFDGLKESTRVPGVTVSSSEIVFEQIHHYSSLSSS